MFKSRRRALLSQVLDPDVHFIDNYKSAHSTYSRFDRRAIHATHLHAANSEFVHTLKPKKNICKNFRAALISTNIFIILDFNALKEAFWILHSNLRLNFEKKFYPGITFASVEFLCKYL